MEKKFWKDDPGFLRWCEDHPNGFFWNCGANQNGDITTVSLLHAAMHKGGLCPHFKNRRLEGGHEANLTWTHAKVCFESRDEVKTWAKKYPAGGGGKGRCSQCTGLATSDRFA